MRHSSIDWHTLWGSLESWELLYRRLDLIRMNAQDHEDDPWFKGRGGSFSLGFAMPANFDPVDSTWHIFDHGIGLPFVELWRLMGMEEKCELEI